MVIKPQAARNISYNWRKYIGSYKPFGTDKVKTCVQQDEHENLSDETRNARKTLVLVTKFGPI